MDDRTAKLVVFGGGGDTVYLSANAHISGYGSPERPHAAECRDGKDLDIPDGCPAVDLREAIKTTEGFNWVIKGPMVNIDLDDGARSDLALKDRDMGIVGAIAAGSPEFSSLLQLQRAHEGKRTEKAGPLDHVAIPEYLDGWRAHGAKVGEYQGGTIVWE